MKVSKSDITLNEQDALLDMLGCENQLMVLYATAIYEGSNKSVRKQFSSNLTSVAQNQYCIFDQMKTRGYYQPAPASKEMIDNANDTFKKQKKTLSKAE